MLNKDNTKEYNINNISNNFCNFFSNIGVDLANNLPKSNKTFKQYLDKVENSPLNSLFLSPTNEIEIIKMINSMKNKFSSDKLIELYYAHFHRILH